MCGHHVLVSTFRGQKGAADPLELELWVVVSHSMDDRNHLRATSAQKHRATSPVPLPLFILYLLQTPRLCVPYHCMEKLHACILKFSFGFVVSLIITLYCFGEY